MSTMRYLSLAKDLAAKAAVSAKDKAISAAATASTFAVKHTKELIDANTPSYKSSATASAAFAVVTAISYLEGGKLTTLLAASGMLFEGAVAVNQYGAQKLGEDIASPVLRFFNQPKTASAQLRQIADEAQAPKKTL